MRPAHRLFLIYGMKMKLNLKVIATASVVVVLAACGGGGGGASTAGPEVTVPEATGTSQDTGLAPNPNGFAFPNFGSAGSPEVFGETDLVSMFGATPDICVDGVADPCKPTAEAAAWARMVNDARVAGHCEGFAVLAAARFSQAVKPNSVELLNQGDVTHGIMRAFATQFLKETQDETNQWAKKSLKEKVAALEASFAKKIVGYSLGVYTDEGGHAVLPYAVEYETADLVKIKIYDSNWPGQDRFVKVDLAKGTWEFSFAGADPNNDPNAWTGKSKDLDITSMDTRAAGTCPFCGDKSAVQKSLLVVRSALPNWKIETADGVLTPGSNEIGNSSVRPLRSSAAGPAIDAPTDYVVSIPDDKPAKFTLPSATRISGITSKVAVQIETPGSADTTVSLSSDAVSTTNPEVVLTLADGNLVGSSNGDNNSVTSSGDAVQIVVDGANGTPVTVDVNADAAAVDVRTPGRDGVDANTNYEVVTQSSDTQVERKVVGTNGKETTTTEDGQLNSTKVENPLPDALKAPAVKGGLPDAASRTFDAGTAASTTTSVAGGPSTTAKKTTASTLKPTATTAPQTATTAAKVARASVRVDVNVEGWSLAASDPASSGFSANLTGSTGAIQDGINCDSVGCLEGAATDVLASGTDPATGATSTTTLQFKMSGVASTFDVRCGNAGSWVKATQAGGGFSATCSFSNVTTDETIYVRA